MIIDPRRVLVTGAEGMLGSYVAAGIRTDRARMDIRDIEQVRAIFAEHRPMAVLHLAAATDLVRCQQDPAGTYLTNTVGTYHVALAAREYGAKLSIVSTSAVFDGKKEEPYTEADLPNPQTHYGHSKYIGELAAIGVLAETIVARTCWMFGGGPGKDHKFVANILKQLSQSRIQVISGKRGSPTYGKDFIEALLWLFAEDAQGVFHVGNTGAPTRTDIAREIVRITGSAAEVVETDAAAFEAQYPGAGMRGNESIASHKLQLRPWQDALAEYLIEEWPDYIRKTQV